MFLCPPDRPLLHVAPLLLRLFYVIFGYCEKEIFLLHIWIVHSCKNLENQTPTLEGNAVQILNGCVTSTLIHRYLRLLSLYIPLAVHTEQLYRYTEQDGCKGCAISNFSWDTDYPDCGFLWFSSLLPGKFWDSTFS
jgi:hypothetical protein